MAEPIFNRAIIAERASQAALAQLSTGEAPKCPYPEGSAAAMEWGTALVRYLHLHSTDDVEGGA